MLVVEGPNGNGIGKSLALKKGFELVASRSKVYPDGESEVGIEGLVMGRDVTIVQSGFPNPDKSLFEALLLSAHARREGAKSVALAMPYLIYARQDKELKEKKVVVSLNVEFNLMRSVGIDALFTVAPHNPKSLSNFRGLTGFSYATETLANEVRKDLSNPYVLAPDKGALVLAMPFAKALGCGFTNINKQRDRLTGEISISEAPDVNFSGHDVIIPDDIISTGGTTALSGKFAFEHGARKVVAAAVHALMVGNAREKIKEAGISKVYGTNTVKSDGVQVADVTDEIARGLVAMMPERFRVLRN